MSVNLGSAHGDIILDGSGVEKGVNEAVQALGDLDRQSRRVGQAIEATADEIGDAGKQMGDGLARGADDAADAVRKAGDAADKAEGSVRNLASSSESVSGAFDRLANTAALFGAAVAAGVGLAVKGAADLESAVARISTIAPEIDVTQVTTALEDMSGRVAQTSVQLAESLNNIFSSINVNQEEALKLTEQFGRGAVAAGTDAETFGTAILGVLNAYGLAVSEADHLSDVFFNTIKVGVVSGDELARGLGQVTQQAKLAGVNFDTLGALIAGVTREGGEAATNINNLSNVLNKITTEDVQKGLKDLGIESKDQAGNFRSIVDVLGDLKARLDTLSEGERSNVLQKLFPDAQARAGISTLISQLDTVRTTLDENARSAGAADEAYAKMGNTAAAQGQILKNTLSATLNDIGRASLPTILALAKTIQAMADAFSALPGPVRDAVVQITLFAAAIALIGASGIKAVATMRELAVAIQAVASATTLAGTSTAGLLGRLALFLGPLLAVGKGFEVLYQQSIPETISSIIRYGDAWAKGREEAERAFQSNKDNLTEVRKLVEQASDKLPVLQAQIDALYEAGGSPLNDPFRLRRLEAERENTERYIETLKKLADQEQATQEAQQARARAGLKSDFIGPVLTIAGPGIEKSEIAALREAALASNTLEGAMLRLRASGQAVAPTFGQVYDIVQQLGGAAGQAANETDTLSASYFANAEAARAQAAATAVAASQMEILTGLQTRLADLGAEAAAVTSRVQPMQAAFDLLNQKVAAGIPLTNEQAHLLSTLPGYIAQATSGYDQLVTSQAQAAIAIQNAQRAATPAGAGFNTLAGQASQLQGALDSLRASAIQLEGAIGALGTENGKLGAQYNILNERVQALNEKKKEGGKLTADEVKELAILQGALDTLGGKMGDNAAEQRALILQLLGVEDQTTKTTGALNAVTNALGQVSTPTGTAADGLVGLTDGFGGVATAAGGAVTPVQNAASAVNSLPASKTVAVKFEIEGLSDGGPASSVAGALNEFNVGDQAGTITQQITVDADTSAATTKLGAIKTLLTELNSTTADPNITATDTATAVANGVTVAIGTIPPSHDTNVTATDNASFIINQVRDAINNLPTTFSITAHVDTSGALAAIQTLRNNMPSSPAKEGPFRTLPDWGSVFSTLAPAADAAVDDTGRAVGELASVVGGGLREMSREAADEASSLMASVQSAAESGVAALAAISGVQGVTGQQLSLFSAGLTALVETLIGIAESFAGDALEAAKSFGESAAGIIALVVPAVEAFDALRKIVEPTQDALGVFGAGVGNVARVIVEIAKEFDADALDAASAFSDAALKMLALIVPAVEAFEALRTITQPTADQLGVFLSGISNLALVIVEAAQIVGIDALPGATAFADFAAKAVALIVPAVEGFAALRDIVQPTADQLGVFMGGIGNLVSVVVQASRLFAAEAFPHATEFADLVAKSLGLLVPAVEGFEKLKEVTQPTADQLGVFMSGITNVASVVAQASTLFAAETLAHASAFADYAAQAIGLIGAGVDGFAKLASDEFRLPDEGRFAAFASGIASLARAVAAAAATMAVEVVEASGKFSEDAAKSVALLGEGVEGLSKLVDFRAPTDAAIAAFVATVVNVVRRIAAASTTIEAEAVKAAAVFSEGAGKAVALIGDAINALTIKETLDKEGKPKDVSRLISTAEIDALVDLIGYVTRRMIDLGRSFNTGDLAKVTALADAASAGLSALGEMLDTINISTDDKKKPDAEKLSPAQAIDQLIALFTAGLGRLLALATVADEYKRVAYGIRDTMREVAFALTESIGAIPFGASLSAAQLALATNDGQFLIRAEVVHRHEPIDIRFLGENGTWIVKSLQTDSAARDEVAGIIAAEIMDAPTT